MTPLLMSKNHEAAPPAHYRNYYEGIGYETLYSLWRRKWLIAAIVLTAFLLAFATLLLMRPRYSAEAIILPNFNREEPDVGAKRQSIASLDASVLVESTARIVRSRATASAVVARLGLATDPAFAHEPTSLRLLSAARSALGLEQPRPAPSPHDLAVNELMRQVAVTNEPRSYLISVSITAGDPERAATLANAIVLEYLRSQIVQQLMDTKASVEREVTELSSVYGIRHPTYLRGRERLEQLQARLNGIRDGSLAEDVVSTMTGQSFIPAEKLAVPSGPNIPLILGLTVSIALAAGTWLALLLDRYKMRQSADSGSVGPAMASKSVASTNA